jgi:hypothetical protein
MVSTLRGEDVIGSLRASPVLEMVLKLAFRAEMPLAAAAGVCLDGESGPSSLSRAEKQRQPGESFISPAQQ